ncbi:MAG TPA: hypothetical protein VJ750_07555 [Rhizomicrobium sp.]|nr:hypothetical protein [Rhizomicrobium sp.]
MSVSIAAGKQCGTCSLCCKAMVIPELNKPKDIWCQHFARGQGCTIYSDRPQSCRAFTCYWLIDPALGPGWKPDKCKMVLDARQEWLVVHVDPGATDRPWSREPFYSYLTEMAAKNIGRGGRVLVMERGRTIIILPDRSVDLGVFGPGDKIAVSRVMTATGPSWDAKVIAAPPQGAAGA